MLRDLLSDVRHSLRVARRSPGFTATVVLTLALGIGANAAIFGVVDAVLLRELPVQDPQRLVLLSDGSTRGRMDGAFPRRLDLYPHPLYRQLADEHQGRGRPPVFAGLAAQDSSVSDAMVRRQGVREAADRAAALCVSGNFFDVLGVRAALGRTFVAGDDAPGASPVVVLAHDYWRRRFGGDPAVVGARLTFNGASYRVLGVTPPGFRGAEVGAPTDLWVPMAMQPGLMRRGSLLDARGKRWLLLVGRLAPGVSMAAAQAAVNVTVQRYLAGDDQLPALERDPRARQAVQAVLQPGATGLSAFRQGFREPLLALMAGVGVLLLIVCLNVSHLLLARAVSRRREMSIRTALGASSWRLVRQMLAEALLLAALGAVLAALMSRWLSDALVSVTATRGLEVGGAFDDLRVAAFTGALALGAALLLGLVPAWQASRADVQQDLRAASPALAGGGSRQLLGRLLLVSQVALSLVLVVGAALLAGTLGKLRGLDKGFDEGHLLTASVLTRETGLAQPQVLQLMDDVVRRLSVLPGVRTASFSFASSPVRRGGWGEEILAVGGTSLVDVKLAAVSPGYFGTLGLPLVHGRSFTADDRPGAPRVAVVNEALARVLFAGRGPLGQRFRFDPVRSPSMHAESIEVVGVVKDAVNHGLRDRPMPMAYLSLAQTEQPVGTLDVRTAGDPALLAGDVRRTIEAAHPGLPVLELSTMRARVERVLWRERVLSVLATGFGLAALFLVSVGLYGVIAQWAGQRTREIGLRVALGATTTRVRWLVMRQAFALVAAGVAIGLPAAVGAGHVLEALLYGLRPVEPLVLTAAVLVMLAVAALAAYWPARRASRVEPMRALRSE
jgi:predicted permease